jgi:hypothetical protein
MSKWYPQPSLADGSEFSKRSEDIEDNNRWLGVDLAEYGRKKSDGDVAPLSKTAEAQKRRLTFSQMCPCLGFIKAICILGSCAGVNVFYKITRSMRRWSWYGFFSTKVRAVAVFLTSLLGKNSVEMSKLPFRCFFSSIVISLVYIAVFAWDGSSYRGMGGETSDSSVSTFLLACNVLGQLFMWSSFLLVYCTVPAAMPGACYERYRQALSQVVRCYSLGGESGAGCRVDGDGVSCTDIYAPPSTHCHTPPQPREVALRSRVHVCHRCRLQIPLRGGHCKELDRCVMTYDHFCYFLWSCIHRGNYLYFTMYLIAMNIYIPLFLYTARSYVKKVHLESKLLGYFMIWCIVQWIFVLTLLYHHIQSLALGMTTRERIKFPDYLKPTNPFAGETIWHNILSYFYQMRDSAPSDVVFCRDDVLPTTDDLGRVNILL